MDGLKLVISILRRSLKYETKENKMNVYNVKSKKDGQLWYLHSKIVTFSGNRKQKIYYFARAIQKDFALTGLPEGFEVKQSERTGMPMLKKIKIAK